MKPHHTLLHEMMKFKEQTINVISKGNSVTLVIQPGFNDTPAIGFHKTNVEETAHIKVVKFGETEEESRHNLKSVVTLPQDKVSEVMACLE